MHDATVGECRAGRLDQRRTVAASHRGMTQDGADAGSFHVRGREHRQHAIGSAGSRDIDVADFAIRMGRPHETAVDLARQRPIAPDAAAKLPGVIAVFTAKDYAAAGGRGIVHMANPAGTYDVKVRAFTGPGRQTPFETAHPPLAAERVRFVGEPVAIVIAETQSAAQDAAESVIVHYDMLPAVAEAS